MAKPNEHLDKIVGHLNKAEEEMKTMAEHSHSCDKWILRGLMDMRLIASKVRGLITKQKGENQ